MFLKLMDFMGTAPATESKCMEQVLLLLRLFINCGKLPDSTLKKGFEFLGRPLAPCVRQAGDTDQCSRITIYCRCVAIRTLAAMKSIVIGPATDPTTLAGSSQRFLVDSTLAEHRVLVGPQSKAFFWEKKAKEVAFHLRSLYRVEVEVENETADEVEMDNAAVESQNEPSLKQQQQKGSSFESSSFFSPSFASSSSVAVDISLVKNPQPELGVGVNYMDMDCGAGEFNSYSDNDDDGDNNNNNFVRRLDPFLLPSTDQLQKANKKMHFCGENASSQDTSAVPLNNGGNMDIEDDDDEPVRFIRTKVQAQTSLYQQPLPPSRRLSTGGLPSNMAPKSNDDFYILPQMGTLAFDEWCSRENTTAATRAGTSAKDVAFSSSSGTTGTTTQKCFIMKGQKNFATTADVRPSPVVTFTPTKVGSKSAVPSSFSSFSVSSSLLAGKPNGRLVAQQQFLAKQSKPIFSAGVTVEQVSPKGSPAHKNVISANETFTQTSAPTSTSFVTDNDLPVSHKNVVSLNQKIRFVAQGLKQQKKQQKLKHLNDIRELEQQQNLEHSAKQVIKTGNQATSNYVPKFDFFGPLSAVKKAKKYLGMEKVRKIEQEERENSERKRKEDELAKQASKKLMKTSSAKSPAQTPVLATGGEVKQSRLPESAKHSVSNNTSASGSPSPLPSTPVPPVQRTSLKLRLRKMISSDGNDEVYSSEHIENLSYVAKSADDYNKETKVRTEAVTASTEKKSKCYRKVDLSQHNTASAKVPLTTTIKRVYDSDDNDDPDKPDDNDNNINADDNETVDTGDSFSKSSANDFASTSVDNAASITETAAKSADAENANAKLLANELVSTEISVFHSASTSADNATSSLVVKNADANSGEKKVATNDNETSQFPKTQPSTSTSADDQVLNTTATKNKNGLLTSEEGAANNAPVQKRKRGRPRKDEQTKAADLQKRQQAKAEAEIAAATATDSTEAAVDPNRRMSARRKAVPEKAVSEMVKPTTPKTTPSFTSTVTSAPAVDGVVLVKRKRGRPPKYPRPEVPQPVAKTAIESQVESTPASAETAASEGDLAEKLNESEGQLDKLQKLPVSAAEDDVAEKVNSSKEQAKSAAVSEQTAENDAVEKLNSSEEVKLESKMPARNTTTDDDVAVASEKLLSSTKSTAPSESPPTLEPVVASSTKFYCLGSAKKQWLSSTLPNLNEIEVSESDHDSQQSQAAESVAITTIRKSLRKKASRQFSSAEKQSKPLEVLSDDVQTDQPTTSTAVNETEIVKEAVVEKEVVEQNVNDKPEREFLEICSNEVEQVAGGESPKTAKVAAPLTEENDNVTQSIQGEKANENPVSAKRKSPESDAESDASLSFSTRRSLRSVKSTDYRSMNNGQLSSFPEKEVITTASKRSLSLSSLSNFPAGTSKKQKVTKEATREEEGEDIKIITRSLDCRVCQKGFASKKELYPHLYVDHKQYKFFCIYGCPRISFEDTIMLHKHIRLKHHLNLADPAPWKCFWCPSTTEQTYHKHDSYYKHWRNEHQMGSYSCSSSRSCSRNEYPTRMDAEAHLMLMHKTSDRRRGILAQLGIDVASATEEEVIAALKEHPQLLPSFGKVDITVKKTATNNTSTGVVQQSNAERNAIDKGSAAAVLSSSVPSTSFSFSSNGTPSKAKSSTSSPNPPSSSSSSTPSSASTSKNGATSSLKRQFQSTTSSRPSERIAKRNRQSLENTVTAGVVDFASAAVASFSNKQSESVEAKDDSKVHVFQRRTLDFLKSKVPNYDQLTPQQFDLSRTKGAPREKTRNCSYFCLWPYDEQEKKKGQIKECSFRNNQQWNTDAHIRSQHLKTAKVKEEAIREICEKDLEVLTNTWKHIHFYEKPLENEKK